MSKKIFNHIKIELILDLIYKQKNKKDFKQMDTKKENISQRIINKNVKLVEAKNTDTLLISILLSLELEKRNNNTLDNNGKF